MVYLISLCNKWSWIHAVCIWRMLNNWKAAYHFALVSALLDVTVQTTLHCQLANVVLFVVYWMNTWIVGVIWLQRLWCLMMFFFVWMQGKMIYVQLGNVRSRMDFWSTFKHASRGSNRKFLGLALMCMCKEKIICIWSLRYSFLTSIMLWLFKWLKYIRNLRGSLNLHQLFIGFYSQGMYKETFLKKIDMLNQEYGCHFC